jgi:hypothetical protein
MKLKKGLMILYPGGTHTVIKQDIEFICDVIAKAYYAKYSHGKQIITCCRPTFIKITNYTNIFIEEDDIE